MSLVPFQDHKFGIRKVSRAPAPSPAPESRLVIGMTGKSIPGQQKSPLWAPRGQHRCDQCSCGHPLLMEAPVDLDLRMGPCISCHGLSVERHPVNLRVFYLYPLSPLTQAERAVPGGSFSGGASRSGTPVAPGLRSGLCLWSGPGSAPPRHGLLHDPVGDGEGGWLPASLPGIP